MTWVRDSLRSGSTIKVVNDQFNTPTLSIDCAEAIRELVKNCAWGIYHTAGLHTVGLHTVGSDAQAGMSSPGRIGKFHKMLDVQHGPEKM